MDIPNEIYDAIVSKIHDEYCNCPSAFARRTIWRDPRWDNLRAWNPRELRRELYKLQLVSKRFYAAATKVLFSHMSFAFGMNYKNISDIARKMALLTSEANQEIMSRITGARFDMEFSPMSRHLQTFGQRGAEADVVTVAESARDDFLRRLPRVKAPLSSVTALELYLEIAEHSSQLLYPNIAAFVRNNLPNLSDLYVECSSRTFAAMNVLANLRPEQRKRLRRLMISCRMDPIDVSCQVEQLPKLCELGLSNVTLSAITLHPENRGLTRLHLSHLSTSAGCLRALVMAGFASACAAKVNYSRRDSRLTELVLTYVRLDMFLCKGEIKEAGTWRDVFRVIRKYCPQLKYVKAVYCSYGRRVRLWVEEEERKSKADMTGLKKLVEAVRFRPGGEAKGAMKDAGGTVYSF